MFFLKMKDKPKPKKRNAMLITIDSSPHSEAIYKLGVARRYIKLWTSTEISEVLTVKDVICGISDKPRTVNNDASAMHKNRSPTTVAVKLLFSIISTRLRRCPSSSMFQKMEMLCE